jgi:hypothetical protein
VLTSNIQSLTHLVYIHPIFTHPAKWDSFGSLFIGYCWSQNFMLGCYCRVPIACLNKLFQNQRSETGNLYEIHNYALILAYNSNEKRWRNPLVIILLLIQNECANVHIRCLISLNPPDFSLQWNLPLVLNSVRDWVDPWTKVRPEGLSQSKIPMTPSGTKPATCTAVP